MNLRGSLFVLLIITVVIVTFVLDVKENGALAKALAKGGGRGGGGWGGGRSSSKGGRGSWRGSKSSAAADGSSAGYKTPDHQLLLLLLLAPGIQRSLAMV